MSLSGKIINIRLEAKDNLHTTLVPVLQSKVGTLMENLMGIHWESH